MAAQLLVVAGLAFVGLDWPPLAAVAVEESHFRRTFET